MQKIFKENYQSPFTECGLIREKPSAQEKLDQYLNYVQEEEAKGKQFAEIGEFMEDMADFSKISAFRADPYVGPFFQNPWMARMISIGIWLLLLALPLEHVLMAVQGKEKFSILKTAALGILFLFFTMNFCYYRRLKKKAFRGGNEDEPSV